MSKRKSQLVSRPPPTMSLFDKIGWTTLRERRAVTLPVGLFPIDWVWELERCRITPHRIRWENIDFVVVDDKCVDWTKERPRVIPNGNGSQGR